MSTPVPSLVPGSPRRTRVLCAVRLVARCLGAVLLALMWPLFGASAAHAAEPGCRVLSDSQVSVSLPSGWDPIMSGGNQASWTAGVISAGFCKLDGPFDVSTLMSGHLADFANVADGGIQPQWGTATVDGIESTTVQADFFETSGAWRAIGEVYVPVAPEFGVIGWVSAYNADRDQASLDEAWSIITSAQFHDLGGPTGPAQPGSGGGATPFRTVVGGAAAVAAAAVAIASAASAAGGGSGSQKQQPDQQQPDPTKPVGYILQLSTASITVTRAAPSGFWVHVYAVWPDGNYAPYDGAAIDAHGDNGIAAAPESGSSPVYVTVSATDSVEAAAVHTVTVTAAGDGSSTSAQVQVALGADPTLEISPDTARLIVGAASAQSAKAEVQVWVANAGEGAWEVKPKWSVRGNTGDAGPQLATTSFTQTSPTSWNLSLEARASQLPETQVSVAGVLMLTAQPTQGAPIQPPLERHLAVSLTREGLSIDWMGRSSGRELIVDATGTGQATEVYVSLLLVGTDGVLRSDSARASDLTWIEFEPDDPTSSGGRAWEATPVTRSLGGIQGGNHPSAIHRLSCAKKLPTGPEPLPVPITIRYLDRPEDAFSQSVVVRLSGSDTLPYSPGWYEEYQRCLKIIADYVPNEFAPRFVDLVEKNKLLMSAEGLYQLRHDIWTFAQGQLRAEFDRQMAWEATLAQYEIVTQLVADLGGIAFNAVIAEYYTVKQLAYMPAVIGMLKPMLIDAFGTAMTGGSAQEWANRQLWMIAEQPKEMVLDRKKIEALGLSWPVAVAILATYLFVETLYKGRDDPEMTMAKAAPLVLKRLTEDEATRLLGVLLANRRAAGAAPRPGVPSIDPAATAKAIGDLGARLRKATIDGVVEVETVRAIMADPAACRTIKLLPPDLQARFAITRNKLYKEADSAVLAEMLAGDPRGAFFLDDFRTGGKSGGHNTDRDVRLVKYVEDADGVWHAVEVPRADWASKYYLAQSRALGGPEWPVEAAQAYCNQHGILATDYAHAEAAAATSDRGISFRGADGHTYREIETSDFSEAVAGNRTIRDPEGLGALYEEKITGPLHAGHTGEAIASAGKVADQIAAVRAGYQKMGYDVGQMPPRLSQAIDVVNSAKGGWTDPTVVAATQAKLQSLGYADGVADLAKDLAHNMGALKLAQKPT